MTPQWDSSVLKESYSSLNRIIVIIMSRMLSLLCTYWRGPDHGCVERNTLLCIIRLFHNRLSTQTGRSQTPFYPRLEKTDDHLFVGHQNRLIMVKSLGTIHNPFKFPFVHLIRNKTENKNIEYSQYTCELSCSQHKFLPFLLQKQNGTHVVLV